jgi:hypothetical protein
MSVDVVGKRFGVLPRGSAPRSMRRWCTSAVPSAERVSAPQAIDNRLRRSGRGEQPEPCHHVKPRQAGLGDRRQLGRNGDAPRARDRERTQLAAAHVRQDADGGAEQKGTCPPSIPCCASPPPLNGTIVISTPVMRRKVSSDRWGVVPMPADRPAFPACSLEPPISPGRSPRRLMGRPPGRRLALQRSTPA